MCGKDGFAITVPDAVKKSSKHLVYVICKFKRGDHWDGQEPKKLNFAFAMQCSLYAYYMLIIFLSCMNGNKKKNNR